MRDHSYTVREITRITGGEILTEHPADPVISELLIDSRRLATPEETLFIALKTSRNDGHRYIPELIEKGVRCFMVMREKSRGRGKKEQGGGKKEVGHGTPVFILVNDTLEALQKLAAHHRRRFRYPVVGITGSNGKTIVKEWLYQLLSPDLRVIRSPKSYNSQIGVPLSVWNMAPGYDLAILEAGISLPGEMERLEHIIRPTIGIFTNLGSAHDEHFRSRKEKAAEKLKLFTHAEVLIYRSDQALIGSLLNRPEYSSRRRFTWGTREQDDLCITGILKENGHTVIRGVCREEEHTITIPFTDDASVENAIHCWALLLVFETLLSQQLTGNNIRHPVSGIHYPASSLQYRFSNLSPVAMRLELREAINRCSLINDSYNSDIHSLGIALDFLMHQSQHPKRTLILSDILQTGRDREELYGSIARILSEKKVDRLIGIGPGISGNSGLFSMEKAFFETTEDFLEKWPLSSFREETILLKGARPFGFERIGQVLQQKSHETVLEINLDALVHNLNHFRAKLGPGVKLMAMVKAFSYGSGSFEIANLLQFHRVDYLAVAYADEGVELRKAGITLPILVMSPEEASMEILLGHRLEPEIYSFRILEILEKTLHQNSAGRPGPLPVHIKLDTGMHRMGFCESELGELLERITANPAIRICSVFSHLAGSENREMDPFTEMQIGRFREMSEQVISATGYPVLRHILNSAGIIRFPGDQFEMVRLGVGLYGIGHTPAGQNLLRNVGTLRSVIAQIKTVGAGESIGYYPAAKARSDTLIAIVPVGYADGLDRRLGNGRGHVLVKGARAPIIGNICMDLCMIDITRIASDGIIVGEGDPVVLFGDDCPVTDMARTLDTIPYEILTGISRRVKRIYYHE
jgi:alanine racemase